MSQNQANMFDPAPIALGGFALATLLLSLINAGIAGEYLMPAVIAVAWVYAGFVQLIVGLWELIHNRLFPAITFTSFGAFWISFALFNTFYFDKIPPEHRGVVMALFLGLWIIFTSYMLIGSFKTNIALVFAFILLDILLISASYGLSTNHLGAIHLSGWAGILLAVLVYYIAASDVLNHMFGKTVFPLGKL